MEKDKNVKLTDYEQRLGVVLIDELQSWESTTKVAVSEFYKLVKRLSKVKR